MGGLVWAYWAFIVALAALGVWQLADWSPNAALAAALVAAVGAQLVSMSRERRRG